MSAKSYSLAGLWKARLADGSAWEMTLPGSLDSGNIGYAFVNGVMISDNLNNGMPWDIRVDQHREALNGHPLTIVIVPLRHGGQAISCSPMAGRREEVELTETGTIATELLYYDDVEITIR